MKNPPRKRIALVLLLALTNALSAGKTARNVILLVGDAGGISTLGAASIYAHDKPQSLYIQGMPHVGLAETSSLDAWVTDSAAGMTAIVTGRKTANGMLSMLPSKAPREGAALKTILEYAEERGLATGIVTNMPVWDATPAACYAHAGSRQDMAAIFRQFFSPRYGDGVDVLVGKDLNDLSAGLNLDPGGLETLFRRSGYRFFSHPSKFTEAHNRAASVYDGDDFDPVPLVSTVLEILTRNTQGYFLMIEWDMHTQQLRQGLDRAVVMDKLARFAAEKATPDTLVLYCADHSFGVLFRGGSKNWPLASQLESVSMMPPALNPIIGVDPVHTGEEVLVAARGPGSEQVRGLMPNTQIFRIIMDAYGWPESP